MEHRKDTIVAISTASGQGGIGIVRLSGPDSARIGRAVCNLSPHPREATYSLFLDQNGDLIDQGIAVYFQAPNSYTGEDVFELQAHGSSIVLNILLQTTVSLGARLAKPGEFTERAFLNGKMDLAQAEAVADMIQSTTEQAARAAARSLTGEFSNNIHQLIEALIYLRSYVEAALDFPEEDVDFLSDGIVEEKLRYLQTEIKKIIDNAEQGALLREGITVAIIGQPNAGKSSLLNGLSQRDVAIVTDIAGTTRDTLQQQIHIDGLPVNIIDTAGLHKTEDIIETEGIKRAWQAIEQADRVLLVIDSAKGFGTEDKEIIKALPEKSKCDLIYNKIDLSGTPSGIKSDTDYRSIYLSIKTGEGVDLLLQHLKQCAGYRQASENIFIARKRHIEALKLAKNHIDQAGQQLAAAELMAEELSLAQNSLSTVTGEFTNDDLLGRIFSSFCIGK